MDWSLVLALLAVVALIAANGLFVAAEFSLVAVDRSEVARLADDGDRGAKGVQAALRRLSTQLSGAQLGITVTSLLVGFIAEPSIARLLRPLADAAGVPDAASPGLSLGLALVVATVAQMVLGELVPKNWAIAKPLAVARFAAPPQRLFSRVTAPLLVLFNGAANAVVRLLGVEPQEELRSAREPDELAMVAAASREEGLLDPEVAGVLSRALRFDDKRAVDVMTPRVQVRALPATATVADLLDVAGQSTFSRLPVYDGSIDTVVGVVHVAQAFTVPRHERASTPVLSLAVPPVEVPSSLDLDGVLAALQGPGRQLAVVVDEYGGTDGILTVEDLLEELVGEITDEHEPDGHAGPQTREIAPGILRVPGSLRLDEAADRHGLPAAGRLGTLAAALTDGLGRLPVPGDEIAVGGWTVRAATVRKHRVVQADLMAPGAGDGDPGVDHGRAGR